MQNSANSTNARIYLDHNATTPPSEVLRDHWNELFNLWGNPSSIHFDSRAPKTFLRETRQKIAKLLNISPLEIIFNSGASEGNNSVLKSVWENLKSTRPEFIISAIEHPSVMRTVEYLESLGAVVHKIEISREGEFNLQQFKKCLSSKTAIVSVMYANNETGFVFPIKEIAKLAHAAGAFMHSDCVQMIAKTKYDFKDLDLDYATFSAHKFYGLKGTGFVYVKKGSAWTPLINGGGQERARRGGTENILGIAALGLVLDEILDDVQSGFKKVERMEFLRNRMESLIVQNLPNVTVTGALSNRLSNTSSLVIDGVDGETLLMSLDLKGFSVSTGAACSSGSPEPSPVLLAIGMSSKEAQNSLRVSLGWKTTLIDIEKFVEELKLTVEKLRAIEEESTSHVS